MKLSYLISRGFFLAWIIFSSKPPIDCIFLNFYIFSDEYQVIDEYNQEDPYSRSSYDRDVHDRRHSRSKSRDRDIRKPPPASNNQQLPVCQWYSQRGVCRRFKSLCPKSHPGAIADKSGMVHERPKGGQEKDSRVLPNPRSREPRRSRSRSRERFPRRSRSRERDSRPYTRTRRSRSRSRDRIYGNSRSREHERISIEQQVPPTTMPPNISTENITLTENNISQPDITQPDVSPISTDIIKPPPSSMYNQILDSIKTKAGLGETLLSQPENPVVVKPLIMPIKSLAQDLGENIMGKNEEKSEGFKDDITKRRFTEEQTDIRRSRFNRSRSRESTRRRFTEEKSDRFNDRKRSRSRSREAVSKRRFTEEKSDRGRDRRRPRSRSRDNNRRSRSRSGSRNKDTRKPEAASNGASKKLIPYEDSDDNEDNASKKLIPYEDSESEGEDDDGNWKRKHRS